MDGKRVLFRVGLIIIGGIIALLLIPVSRRIAGPIKQLSRSALRIAEGDLSHRAMMKSKDEIPDDHLVGTGLISLCCFGVAGCQ